MRALPTGTVTFLFSDIEGSTRLLQEYAAEQLAAFDEQERLVRRYERFFVELAMRTEPELFTAAEPEAISAMEIETANLRAADALNNLDCARADVGERGPAAAHMRRLSSCASESGTALGSLRQSR